ncbi:MULTISPECIES: efflux RND transporter periplasmic adaptor subunit [unclassified Pseudomonas]|uniref:efflux RND transporter periplasmic adaptor subunit n=1 Tax=unclassified Pseudomonas TaxID=196821 RepID=UPI002096D6BA|nr:MULTISPECIES: efflux RND transporter periplasmic adaptor subunit [unclassified Pseudomonas]MCO7519067.1 efflux RND transporter periplasmic adaptor subunit [Pseudomonas sp. 1]MCO7539908.1 efflux RND transporter periplasmic adaptor subunit [Pseudomonas sp. VA159-2]
MQAQPTSFPKTLVKLVCVVAISMLLCACEGPKEAPAPTAIDRTVLTVTVATPTKQLLIDSLTANGPIAAWQEAVIGPEVNGLRVDDVLVQVGDQVRKGQALATFAKDTVQHDYRLAKAALDEAITLAHEAQADGERARELRDIGGLSGQQIQQMLTQEQATQARVDAARARLAIQKLHLSQTILRAPDDGIISARLATVGSVPAQGTEMFRMIRQGRLEWRAELTAQQLAQVRPGQESRIASPDGGYWNGRVRQVAPTVDSTSRRGVVYVDITGPALQNAAPLPAGAYVKGEMLLGAKPGMTVPQTAVVARDGFHLIFKVNDDQRVAGLKVEVGRVVGDRQEILSGLEGSERVVVAGGAFLNSGDLVQITEGAELPPTHDPR